MKSTLLVVVLGFLAMSSVGFAMSFPKDEASITLSGRISYPYISHCGGTAYLTLSLATSDRRMIHRAPMNISVVLDRSGSMGDEGKIEHAKAALYALIDQLQSEDILSIVIYDDDVEVLRDAHRVGTQREELRRLVGTVYPRGSTNLGGGMMEGLRQVERNVSREYVNRVILLSDGLANRGITDPGQLSAIARRYRGKSISLTTMGVGLAYNENLMVSLSESGGGNYYFIESSHGLAAMMQKELQMLSSVLAQNASIELTLGRGVTVTDVIGAEFRTMGNKVLIPVGDLYVSECRELTVTVQVPEGSGSLVVARGSLKFETGDVRIGRVSPFAVKVQYSTDVAVIEKNRDWDTQAKADVAVSTRKVEDVLKAIDEGREEDAARQLGDARASLEASPAASMAGAAASEVMREQKERLNSYNSLLKDSSNAARAKKAIQYDNYRTQKKR